MDGTCRRGGSADVHVQLSRGAVQRRRPVRPLAATKHDTHTRHWWAAYAALWAIMKCDHLSNGTANLQHYIYKVVQGSGVADLPAIVCCIPLLFMLSLMSAAYLAAPQRPVMC